MWKKHDLERISRRYTVSPLEVRAAAMFEIQVGDDVEIASDVLRKAADRYFKRQQRRDLKENSHQSLTCKPVDSIPADKAVQLREFRELVNQIVSDDFEREAVQVMLGEHPVYEDETAFVRESPLSQGHAYRRLKRLKSGIRRVVEIYRDLIG